MNIQKDEPKICAAVTATIFPLVAAAHFVRLFTGFELHLGTYHIPTWVSIIGLVVAGFLSYSDFRIATRR